MSLEQRVVDYLRASAQDTAIGAALLAGDDPAETLSFEVGVRSMTEILTGYREVLVWLAREIDEVRASTSGRS